MKKFFLILIFLVWLSHTTDNTVYSQGTFGCYAGPPGTQCTTINYCENGYIPAFDCANYISGENGTGCPFYSECVLPEELPRITPPATPTPGRLPADCGNLGQQCCGVIPPLYCNPPYIPSNDQSGTGGCICLDPASLIKPPPESGCISYPPEGCPSWSPNACYGSNYVWCCTDAVACGRAKEIAATEKTLTVECDTPAGPKTGIQTALGCIPAKNPTQFVGWILRFAVGIGGGISFLLIIFGAIKVLTSGGNPENVKAGQEMITSALTGLIFIIFSLFLLKLIGVEILQLPEFGQ